MKNLLLDEVKKIAKGLKISLSYKAECGTRKRYTKEELISLIEKAQSNGKVEAVESTFGETVTQTINLFKELVKASENKKVIHNEAVQHIMKRLNSAMSKKQKNTVSQWQRALNVVNFMYKAEMQVAK